MTVVNRLLGSQLADIAQIILGLNVAYDPDLDEPYGVESGGHKMNWGDGFRAVIPLGTTIPVESDAGDVLGSIVLGDFSWEFQQKEADNG